MAKGLVWAMEELAEQEAAQAEVEVIDGVDSLENDIISVNDSADTVDNVVQAIEEAEEDVDTLEDIASVMDESSENGGLDETAARVAEIAVESIYKRLGVRTNNAMPSMESFGGKTTRISATKIAVENIKEMAKKAWDAIVKALESIGKWIVDFWNKLFDANTKLKARSTSLLETVKSTEKYKEDKSKKLTIDTLANSLVYKGQVSTANVKSGIAGILVSVGSFKALTDDIDAFAAQTDHLTTAVASEDGMAKFSVGELTINGFTKVTEAEGFDKAPEKSHLLRSPELIGNMAIIISTHGSASGKDAFEALASSDVKVGKFNPKATASKEVEIALPARNDLISIINDVSKITDQVAKNKEEVKALNKANKELVAYIKKVSTEVTDDEGVGARTKLVQKAITKYSKFSASAIVAFNKTALTGGKAGLDFVEKAVKASTSAAKKD